MSAWSGTDIVNRNKSSLTPLLYCRTGIRQGSLLVEHIENTAGFPADWVDKVENLSACRQLARWNPVRDRHEDWRDSAAGFVDLVADVALGLELAPSAVGEGSGTCLGARSEWSEFALG